MERWGLSPRVSTPSPGQRHVRQRHLRQWRADGDLADQPTDAPCTTDARTTCPYSRRAQRQCRTPSLMRSAMMTRALSAPFGKITSLARAEKILHSHPLTNMLRHGIIVNEQSFILVNNH